MFRVDNASSVVSLPSPSAPGTPGYFTPGNPGTGAPPTILQAEWCNRIQEELMSIVLAQSAITPSKTVYTQVAQSLLSGALTFALDTSGAANTITAALPVAPVALTDGMKITVKIANTNTGATNLNLNALGNKPCYYKGSAFIGGEVTAGQYYDFIYSSGGNLWTLDSPSGGQAGLYIGTAATGGTANAQTVNVTPGGYARKTGNLINVLAGATNTTALTLNINGVGAVTVKKRSGASLVDLASGDWVNTQEYLLQDDSVYYELVDQPIPSFGALATMGIGANLEDDGSGNLRVSTTASFATGVTAVTQSANNNTTKLATTQYADAVIPPKLSTASGSAPSYSSRAWVNFLGASGTINASGNVSSVTRNGTGDYTVNFTTAMADANYCATFAWSSTGAGGNTPSAVINTLAAGSCRLEVKDQGTGNHYDPSIVCVNIIR